MEKLLCNLRKRTTDCYFRICKRCVANQIIEDELTLLFEANAKEDIIFQQRLTTDRCNLETIIKPVDEFVSYFVDKMDKLVTHDFICKEQSSFLNNKKDSLKQNEIIVLCDFAENYSFIIQNAAQGYHWNNSQAIIHPFVIYYKQNNSLENISFIIISEVLTHDTTSVLLFISKMLDFLKQKICFSKIYFMSDGTAAHYKNKKNFASLCNYKSKYGFDAEWHFFATSHGKGPCDAIGGTLKRMAKRASLVCDSGNTIKIPRELYNWAVKQKYKNRTKINFCFVSQKKYTTTSQELNETFCRARTITGTHKFHSFIPVDNSKIAVKRYSGSKEAPKIFTLFD